MSLGTIVTLCVYAVALVYATLHWRAIVSALREETSDFGPGSWFATILLAPLMLVFIGMVLLLPIALFEGAFHDSRPDGCYRQTTQYNPATKTMQEHYTSVPCPEERRVP